ncbi:hypothetical protein ILUMI_13894 [Ignelater luminosus]|uniref:Uncharacterized protein n=1 Tax=Ignelater luminosus TaxID=2038154 RepID=A0A8K0CTJ5_IGNLU|nr:hypothetical protein ILUMI_13894 [Ignelater luminosus]
MSHITALSTNQKYLFKTTKAISEATCCSDLALKKPEKLADSGGLSWQAVFFAFIGKVLPSMMKHISPDKLQQYIKEAAKSSSEIKFVDFPRFPYHTQAGERVTKLVTDSSQSVCCPEPRERFLKSRIALQKSMPKYETKKHFKV